MTSDKTNDDIEPQTARLNWKLDQLVVEQRRTNELLQQLVQAITRGEWDAGI